MAGIERRGQQLGSVRVDEETAAPVDADLSSLLKPELVALAEQAGIDPTGMTKAEIIDALAKGSDGDINENP